MAEREIDETSGIATTGHEWDGIKELDNPMPRWWLWTFYATIVFSLGYVIYYPAIPLIESATSGLSGETTRSVLRTEMAEARAAKAGLFEKIAANDLDTIRADEDLARIATAGGASAYKVYCSQCHGTGAAGGPGYPNLNDDDWLWGGDLAAIYTTIKHGVRTEEDEETRTSQMPAFGADEILTREEITAVSHYILKISGQDAEPQLAEAGKDVYLENCAVCHGEEARGNRELGAPNLADAISLYGNDLEQIARQIARPKHGVMPSWQTRLSDETIKQLAIYVHALGGGEKTPVD